MYVSHINPCISPTPSRSTPVPTHSLAQFVLPTHRETGAFLEHDWVELPGATLLTKSPLSLVVIS